MVSIRSVEQDTKQFWMIGAGFRSVVGSGATNHVRSRSRSDFFLFHYRSTLTECIVVACHFLTHAARLDVPNTSLICRTHTQRAMRRVETYWKLDDTNSFHIHAGNLANRRYHTARGRQTVRAM